MKILINITARIKLLFTPKVNFNNIEKIVLYGVRKNICDSDIVSLWDKQVGAITKIQRIVNRETNFYRTINGKIIFDESYRFPNTQEELLIAKLKIKLPTLGKISVKVWCVKGFLFSIEYGKSFTDFEKTLKHLDHKEITISCNIIGDLSLQSYSKRGFN